MHQELVKALYDVYPLQDKNDFFPAYIYMKYIDKFIYYALKSSGLPASEPKEKLHEDLEAMLQYYVQQVADASMTYDTNTYHGKVVKLDDAKKLVSPKKDINVSPPEKVMPYKLARDIILKADGGLAVGTCVCRQLSANPCLPPPQEVCLFVGDPFASFIAEENPLFRKIDQEEAVNILEFVHKQGAVHTAYFKKEMAGRFMAICNCCSCCCVGVRMWNLLGGTVPIMAPSGYVAVVGEDCNGCGACAEKVCNFNAISMDEEAGRAVIDLNKCMGCGVCEDFCPVGAVSLRLEPSKGDPLDLNVLAR